MRTKSLVVIVNACLLFSMSSEGIAEEVSLGINVRRTTHRNSTTRGDHGQSFLVPARCVLEGFEPSISSRISARDERWDYIRDPHWDFPIGVRFTVNLGSGPQWDRWEGRVTGTVKLRYRILGPIGEDDAVDETEPSEVYQQILDEGDPDQFFSYSTAKVDVNEESFIAEDDGDGDERNGVEEQGEAGQDGPTPENAEVESERPVPQDLFDRPFEYEVVPEAEDDAIEEVELPISIRRAVHREYASSGRHYQTFTAPPGSIVEDYTPRFASRINATEFSFDTIRDPHFGLPLAVRFGAKLTSGPFYDRYRGSVQGVMILKVKRVIVIQ